MDLSTHWDKILTRLNDTIGHQAVELWLSNARPADFDGHILSVEVPNEYYRDWIVEKYDGPIHDAVCEVVGHPVPVEFRFDATHAEDSATPLPVDRGLGPSGELLPSSVGVNPAQNFDNFVVGECNKFAHAAALGMADFAADSQYNPLFIYGATGLGKTHLMHAIGNRVLQRDPSARVVYVTSEDFMNEMIRGLRYKRMEEFRNKYRKNATILLVDDIQFLSGKDRTQEEFFHTFNALKSQGRRIVLTSDVEPKHIEKLEDRLRTRFQGGLLADMQPPDPETAKAILWQKADTLAIEVPQDLADTIVNRVSGSIREIEGVLNKLAALFTLHREPLTLELARRHLPSVFASAPAQVSTPAIIEAVAKFHSIRSADITGKKRTRTLTEPRHIAMYLARKHTSLSFPELGREFGGRDHSTVQHGCRKVEAQLADNADLAYKIRLIEQSLHVRQGP